MTVPLTTHTSETAGRLLEGNPISAFIEVTPQCTLVECPPSPGAPGVTGIPLVEWSTDPAPGDVFVIDEVEHVSELTIVTPENLPEGAVVQFHVVLKEAGTGRVLADEIKRFALDTAPPVLHDFSFEETIDGCTGSLEARAMRQDQAASISFAELLVSRDGGASFRGLPMLRASGDFLNPTDFELVFEPLAPGETIFKIRAVDEADNAVETDPHTVIVNHPPDCTVAAASVARCRPPNHKFQLLGIEGVTDPDGDPVTITVTSIHQDEPVKGPGRGSGATCPDGVLVDADGDGVPELAGLRCERDGTGDGRLYTIRFVARDDKGCTCEGAVPFCVSHDGRRIVCTDGGPSHDSTVCAGGGAGGAAGDPAGSGVISLVELEALTPRPLFLRGDVNWDDERDISDGIGSLWKLFVEPGPFDCPEPRLRPVLRQAAADAGIYLFEVTVENRSAQLCPLDGPIRLLAGDLRVAAVNSRDGCGGDTSVSSGEVSSSLFHDAYRQWLEANGLAEASLRERFAAELSAMEAASKELSEEAGKLAASALQAVVQATTPGFGVQLLDLLTLGLASGGSFERARFAWATEVQSAQRRWQTAFNAETEEGRSSLRELEAKVLSAISQRMRRDLASIPPLAGRHPVKLLPAGDRVRLLLAFRPPPGKLEGSGSLAMYSLPVNFDAAGGVTRRSNIEFRRGSKPGDTRFRTTPSFLAGEADPPPHRPRHAASPSSAPGRLRPIANHGPGGASSRPRACRRLAQGPQLTSFRC